MSRRTTRNFFYRLHAWIGLNLSILLVLMFATGTLLVFSAEIEAFLNKDMRVTSSEAGRTATPGEIYDTIRTTYPDVSLGWIERDNASWIGDATVVHTRWGEEIFIWTDPATAEVIGASNRQGTVTRLVREFHDGLLTGHRVGSILISSTALALLFSLVAGLVTYRRFWRGFFRMPPRHLGPRAWWAGLHRLAALWCLPFLIVVCFTGLYYFIGALGVPLGQYPKAIEASERAKRLPAGFSGADLDRATEIATQALPGLDITTVSLPGRAKDGITFIGHTDAILAEEKANTVVIDPTTFEPLGVFRPKELSVMSRLASMINPLHYGQWGGFASRLLWLIFGVFSTGVALFGVMIYATRVLPAAEPAPATASGGLSSTPGPFRRAWKGMNPLKWLVILMLTGALAAGVFRHGPTSDRWVRQRLPDPAYEARLWTRGELRAGDTIELRFRLKQEGAREATVQLGDGQANAILLEQNGETLTAITTLQADGSDNTVILTIPDLGPEGTVLQWRLGRPVI